VRRTKRELAPRRQPGGSSQLFNFAQWLARNATEWCVTILMLLFGTTTIVQAFVVPSGSMEGTLWTGDHLFVDKLVYAPAGPVSGRLLPYQPVRRGDIIVFRYPLDLRQNYVKRVIGVPGDRIRIVNKRLWLNGKPMDEPYTRHVASYADSYRDYFPSTPSFDLPQRAQEMLERHARDGELLVPPGNYFALGDNRDNSEDSRYWGFVPRENIIGKPLIVWWSYDAPGERLADGNIRLDHLADLARNFFAKTRWERTFRPIRSHRID
jgi:signal peptidase I